MLCQNCQQREANIQIIQAVNGETQKIFLCDQCANKAQEVSFVFSPGMIPEFLQALFEFTTTSKNPKEEEACPQCGCTLSQMTQASKLGCSACYQKFEGQLDPLLRRIHGGGMHVGKIPLRRGAAIRSKVEVRNLKEKLRQLINNEEFEAAAVVRDQIRDLEQELGGAGYGEKGSPVEG